MATVKQRAVIPKIVENRGNVSRAMIDVGYDPTTAKNPKNLTDSKGYKEVLQEMGLTEELITTSLVSDIKSKPKKRFLELSLGAELLGMKKAEKNVNANITNIVINYGDTPVQVRAETLPDPTP